MDGNESNSFKERWGNPDTFWTYGVFAGLGIDFKMMTQSTISVNLGFDYLPMNRDLNGDSQFGGFLIHIAFYQPKK